MWAELNYDLIYTRTVSAEKIYGVPLAWQYEGTLGMSIKAMIIDDEPFVRDDLRYMLSAHDEIEVAWEAGKLDEARKLLSENRPDVIFLDIQLRGGSGIDLIPDIDPETRIIFVSAHEENMKLIPDANSVDYILKPVSAGRLAKSLKKLKS